MITRTKYRPILRGYVETKVGYIGFSSPARGSGALILLPSREDLINLIRYAGQIDMDVDISRMQLSMANLSNIVFPRNTKIEDSDLYRANFSCSDIRGIIGLERTLHLACAIFEDAVMTDGQREIIIDDARRVRVEKETFEVKRE